MSKIFLGKTYRTVKLAVLDENTDPIDLVCTNETASVLKGVSKVILSNDLYKGKNEVIMEENLIATKSNVFPNETPSWRSIFDSLEYKVKIDEDDNTKIGHFRFYLPTVLTPQIMILIQSKTADPHRKKLIMMFYGNNVIYNYLQEYLEDSCNCLIKPISLNTEDMKDFIDYPVEQGSIDSIGLLELWFGKLETNGKLGSIIINIGENELKNVYKGHVKSQKDSNTDDEINNEVMKPIFDSLINETKISFNDLKLVKVKCLLFSISYDGRANFSELMSPVRGNEDDRISIWFYLDKLIDNL